MVGVGVGAAGVTVAGTKRVAWLAVGGAVVALGLGDDCA